LSLTVGNSAGEAFPENYFISAVLNNILSPLLYVPTNFLVDVWIRKALLRAQDKCLWNSMVNFPLNFAKTADMPAGAPSENLYQIGIMGASTSFSSSGLRNALSSVERGGYQYALSTLELYSSKWKGHIGLPAHYYKERKFLIAEKGPRDAIKRLPRQLPPRKKAVEGEMKTIKHQVYPRYSSI
jgi:hypothetical protein